MGTDTVRLQWCKVNFSLRSVLNFCLLNCHSIRSQFFDLDLITHEVNRGLLQTLRILESFLRATPYLRKMECLVPVAEVYFNSHPYLRVKIGN